MRDALALVPENLRFQLRPEPMPARAPPMLATLSYERFDDPQWAFERKLDGVRCLGYREGSSVTLWSRNHLQLHADPELAAALCERHRVASLSTASSSAACSTCSI